MKVDVLSRREALEVVEGRLLSPPEEGSVLVTPNLQHVASARTDARLRQIIADAWLALPDGWPVVLAARLRGHSNAERVTGADLLPAILETAQDLDTKVLVVGGREPARAECALRSLGIKQVLLEPAPRGELQDPIQRSALVRRMVAAKPELVILSLGSPREEYLAQDYVQENGEGLVLCIGAGMDFLTGAQHRAPELIRTIGLEWLYRALREPRRLAPRYVRAAWSLPGLFASAIRGRQTALRI